MGIFLKLTPNIFNWIQVWALCKPFHYVRPGLLDISLQQDRRVFGMVVVLEDKVTQT